MTPLPGDILGDRPFKTRPSTEETNTIEVRGLTHGSTSAALILELWTYPFAKLAGIPTGTGFATCRSSIRRPEIAGHKLSHGGVASNMYIARRIGIVPYALAALRLR